MRRLRPSPVLITAGYLLGSQWERVSDTIGAISTPLLIVLALGIAGALVWRMARRRRSRDLAEERSPASSSAAGRVIPEESPD